MPAAVEDTGSTTSQEEEVEDVVGELEEDIGLGFGSLKSFLQWNGGSKQLSVHLRQSVETPRRLEFRLRGDLNTATGVSSVTAHLKKNFYTHVPTLQRVLEAKALRAAGRASDPSIKLNGWVPGGPCGRGSG